jgi:hypothetical protein
LFERVVHLFEAFLQAGGAQEEPQGGNMAVKLKYGYQLVSIIAGLLAGAAQDDPSRCKMAVQSVGG